MIVSSLFDNLRDFRTFRIIGRVLVCHILGTVPFFMKNSQITIRHLQPYFYMKQS